MDLYQSSGSGGSSRLYNQQRHVGGFRFTPNGQLTNGPSLFGTSSNVNTVFGSGITPMFGSSGNQFNFPLRSNRSPNSSGATNRTNGQLSSPSRNTGTSHNHYGVYSKLSPGTGCNLDMAHQYSTNGNSFPTNARANPKHRKTQSPAVGSRDIRILTSSLERSSLNNEQKQNDGESSPEPQYRIFKRGDSYPQIGSDATEEQDGGPHASNRDTTISKPISNEQNSNRNTRPDQGDPGQDGVAENIPTQSNHTSDASKSIARPATNQQHSRTPVSLVAELARFHGITTEYRLVNETGPPHCPIFTVVLHLGGEKHEGVGPSIKKAQAAAAATAIESSTLPKPPPRNTIPKRNYQSWQGSAKGPNWAALQLSALAEQMNQPLHYVNHPVTVVNPFRKVTPVTRVAVHIGDRIFSGEGNTFNAAKNMAVMVALKALSKLRNERNDRPQNGAETTFIKESEDEDDSKSPISIVYEMALKRNMFISYETVKEVGPAHMKVFTVQCKVGDQFTTESDGFTKQQAKKLASELMIAKLKEVPVSGESSIKALQRNLLNHKIIKRKAAAPVLKDIEKASVSPISRLIQIAHLRKYKEPEFSVIVSAVAEDSATAEIETQGKLRAPRRNARLKKPHFVIEVKVGPFSAKGEGPNKKAAKKAAADNALVLLGYPPSEKESRKIDSKPTHTHSSPVAGSATELPSTSKSVSNVLKVISGRSVVPGILVLQNQETGNSECKVETEVSPPIVLPKKEEIASFASPTALPVIHEGVNKLSYLAQLLGVLVSYSDFPKKNEYLSVVSLGTNPPHVSHGIGQTLEDARNNAAMQVLKELSDKGLENDGASQDFSKDDS